MNDRNVAFFSRMGIVTVSSEKKKVNRETTFVNMMVDAVRQHSKTIHFSKFKKLPPASKIAEHSILTKCLFIKCDLITIQLDFVVK